LSSRFSTAGSRAKDEAEGDPALLADGGVVQLVRLDQPLGIAALGHPAEIALVDQAIVHQRVDDPVKQHAKADPGARLPRLCPHDPRAAQREHRDRQPRANYGVKVVLFQHLVMRFVMVTVPAPARPMHDVFVARPGDPFHGDNRGDDNQDGGKRAHAHQIATGRTN